MAVLVEMHHMGNPSVQTEVVAITQHVLSDRSGDWRVHIIGSQANDRWEVTIVGPNGFERSYTLEVSAGEHLPDLIRGVLGRLLTDTN